MASTDEKALLVGGEEGDVEDVEDEDMEGLDEDTKSKLLKDPRILAVLQGQLNGMAGDPAEYVKSLPKVVQKRVKALKTSLVEALNIEAKFYEEVHALEVKYHKMYLPMYEKRRQILSGEYEPTEEECVWTLDNEEEDLSKDLENKAKLDEDKDKPSLHNMTEDTEGIPEFWLTTFKNVDLLSEMLAEHDYPILEHLQDVRLIYTEDAMEFDLEFVFSPNEYFTNTVLTKHYYMKCKLDPEDPFDFEGPEIYKCSGCTIDWKKGKNVTVKTIKKKQKHKTKGQIRTVTKTVPNDSFFNFFNPPQIPDDPNADVDEDTQNLLTSDFEIGHYIRERVIPRAVLYFTGEALEDEDFEEEDDDEDDDDEEEEEEESEDETPTKPKPRKAGRG